MMRQLLEYLIKENNAPREYASTQIDVPKEIAEEILALSLSIPDEEIYDDESGKFGRELDAHITIKYGLETEDPNDVESLIEDGSKPISVRFGKISIFDGSEEDKPYDVVKVSVESKELEELHKRLSELPNGDEHDEYKPHMTIAYVKRGKGEKYDGIADLEGKEFTANSFIFKGKDRSDKEIFLNERILNK